MDTELCFVTILNYAVTTFRKADYVNEFSGSVSSSKILPTFFSYTVCML